MSEELDGERITLCTCGGCPFKHSCLRQNLKPSKNNQKYREFQYKKEWKYGDMPSDICEYYVRDAKFEEHEA